MIRLCFNKVQELDIGRGTEITFKAFKKGNLIKPFSKFYNWILIYYRI